jgi:Polyketide cyclase / dehydrase and lipid transport
MPPRNQRWWLTTDSQSVEIDAPAEHIYDLVTDLPRMGEWSNECGGVEWTNGATAAAPNATFVGHNHTGPRGVIKWSRKGRVLTAERGREFAFVTEEGGQEGVIWRYRFVSAGGRTKVTESYDVKKIPTWARILDVPTNRHGALLKSMRHTLEQLKAAAETATIPGATQ